ncbi:hypothetical protein A7U60_g8336 [Sanghuangporus baumii]|uniref:Fungal-type protein kinase domain-containing protein n=1 Tax=Sanghuangporus baumii TaxID=108892 RepID=A0A9Q5MYS4_SANBA|nr:hypothetical protein A7U60_g8336 [Sanghuangporus baumii]
MSKELLRGQTPLHLERFDWEAFFYVICWVGTHYSNGEEIKTDTFEEWDTDVDKLLVCSKQAVLFGLSRPNLRILFTDFYKPLFLSWIRPIQRMFRDADTAKGDFEVTENANSKDFDDETLGGRITWDKFWQILEK